jgi:hypothetical protein
MRVLGYVERIAYIRNLHRTGNSKGRRLFRMFRSTRKNNIETDLQEIVCKAAGSEPG